MIKKEEMKTFTFNKCPPAQTKRLPSTLVESFFLKFLLHSLPSDIYIVFRGRPLMIGGGGGKIENGFIFSAGMPFENYFS